MIATTITIVRGWKNCYAFLFVSIRVSIHYQLMSSANHLEIIFVTEFVRNIITPTVSSSSWWRIEPLFSIISWIWPKKITQGSIMREISLSVNISYLIKSLYFRRESSMETEDRTINDSWDREALKNLSKPFPDRISVVLFLALIIKTVKFVNLSVFMISSQDGDSVFVFYFEKKNIEKCLYWVETSIDVISHEEIVGSLDKKMSTGSFPQI